MNAWEQTYEDYLSDEPGQHGIPDGLTREQYETLATIYTGHTDNARKES